MTTADLKHTLAGGGLWIAPRAALDDSFVSSLAPRRAGVYSRTLRGWDIGGPANVMRFQDLFVKATPTSLERSPRWLDQRAWRELRIVAQLNELASSSGICRGFVKMLGWSLVATRDGDPFVLMATEYAGEPLSTAWRDLSSGELRGVVFQVLESLSEAQTALAFEHSDLHWNNIVVMRHSTRHGDPVGPSVGDATVATVVDMGLSSAWLRSASVPVLTMPHPGCPSPTADRESFAAAVRRIVAKRKRMHDSLACGYSLEFTKALTTVLRSLSFSTLPLHSILQYPFFREAVGPSVEP